MAGDKLAWTIEQMVKIAANKNSSVDKIAWSIIACVKIACRTKWQVTKIASNLQNWIVWRFLQNLESF